MNLKLLSVASALVVSSTAMIARAEAPTLRIPAQIMSAHPASLGGAFTAVADDQNALYFNPAGLGFIDSTFAALLDTEVLGSLGSGGLSDLVDDFDAVSEAAAKVASEKDVSSQVDNIASLGELVSSRTASLGFRAQSYFVRKRWGLALNFGMQTGLGIHAKLLPEVADLGLYGDLDVRAGYAHPLFDGKVSVGAAPYYRLRSQGGRANFSLSEGLNPKESLKNLVGVGQGFGLDLGVMLRPVTAMSPTFGLAILNVGDTRLRAAAKSLFSNTSFVSGSELVGAPDPIKQIVNAGFSIAPVDGPAFVRVSGELRGVNRPTPAALKPAASVEGGFRSMFIRTTASAGWGNGGWSAGLELRALFKLRLASYIEPDLFFDRVKNQRVWILSAGF
ncbi:MAG: hypothetical protein RIR26_2441 [Pseudomonadota bacterium]